MIFTIRTTSGREDIVIDILTMRLKSEGYSIKAIFHPAEIKGYVFVEGSSGDIHKAIHGMMHVRGVIEKPIKLSDIQRQKLGAPGGRMSWQRRREWELEHPE